MAVWTFVSSGSPIMPKIYVDPKETGHPRQPRVGIDAAGRFVVIWRNSAGLLSGFAAQAQGLCEGSMPPSVGRIGKMPSSTDMPYVAGS